MKVTTGVLCLVLGLAQQAYGDCVPEFFARSIRYDQAVEIDFYYTGINLASVKECAAFCSQREFCRSAVYNTRTKTCGISYEYTVACASRTQRYKEYELENGAGSDLVQIACVDSCREDEKNAVKKEKKVPIGIITGEPNDGHIKESNVITDPLTTPSVIAMISESTSTADRPRAEGYVTRLILANISGLQDGATGSVEPLTLQQHDASVAKAKQGGKKGDGKPPVCYRTIRHRYLLGASFAEHDVNNVNDCRCLCAATHKADGGKNKCQSFQFRNKTCTLNKGSHLGRYDLIEQRKTLYQYVGCDPEILVETAASKCPNFKTDKKSKKAEKKEKEEKEEPTTTTTEKPKVELITAASVEPESTEAPSTTTIEPSTTTVEQETRPTGHDENEVGTETTPEEMIIKKNGCFEVIDDYLMVSVAGGLEHDVSVEECQCMCANSKKSGRYEFQCRSATYYHTEKDCILNLEDRVMKSKFFEKQFTSLNVSYIGMTCEIDESVKSIEKLASAGCRRPEEATTTLAPKKTEGEAKKNGLKTDECYVELNDFVLEGTAIAVETSVTAEECKCKCAEGQKLYGEDCASFLYYYDSKTCLINKQNRFSNPEKFNFVPSINQSRSYFEWTCANKDEARTKYLADTCKVAPEKVEGNLLNHESDPVEVKTDEKMEKEDDTQRLKRLDEKEFLDKIEKVVESQEVTDEKKEEEKSNKKMSEHILEEEELKKDVLKIVEKEVKTKKVNEESLMEKINEAVETLEKSKSQSESEDVKEKVEKEEKTESQKEEVKMKTVNEESLMEKINEAVETLEKSAEVTEPATTTTEATTTAKLILNTKKNTLKEAKKSADLDPDHGKNGTVTMKKVDEKSLENLIKKKVVEGPIITSQELEEVNNDPKRVQMKKVEADVLEKLSKMEVTSGVLEEEIETTPVASGEVTKAQKPTKLHKPKKYNIPEAEGLEDDDVEEEVGEELSTGLDDEPSTEPVEETTVPMTETTTSEQVTTTKAKASGVKTHKFDEKVDKSGMPLPRITTTTEATTTTAGYPPAGRCSYSALYQTSFLGRRLLKAVRVKSPADCFAACYALRCRSANLIAQGDLHSCELYRDSLIDYRRPDMIGYDASTVYFDGINCDGNKSY